MLVKPYAHTNIGMAVLLSYWNIAKDIAKKVV
jgi:hypothetical protein